MEDLSTHDSSLNPIGAPRNGGPSDWAATIDNLTGLANRCMDEFGFEKAVEYFRQAEELWDAQGMPEYSLEKRFDLHRGCGKAFTSLGKLDEAVAEYKKLLKLSQDSSNTGVKAETYVQIGQLLCKKGDYDRALGYVQRALGAYRRLNDHVGACKALRNLGVVYVELGELEEADLTYQEAVDLAESLDDPVLFSDLVNNQGAITNMRGEWKKALSLYQRSLKIYTEHGEIRKAAYTQNNIAITLIERGRGEDAFEHLLEAHRVAEQIKDGSLGLIVDINLADLFLKQNKPTEARKHCWAAEARLEEQGKHNGQLVEIRRTAGKIAMAEDQLNLALMYFNAALDLSREISTRYQEAEVLRERGVLYQKMERSFDALNDLEASYRLFSTLKADSRKEQTEDVINSIEELYLEIFDSIASDVDRKDKYTKGHSDRVASFSLLLAKECGLHGNELKTIVAGALLHDIGKVRISDAVLNKVGLLNDDEFDQIKKHPQYGVEILGDKEFPWDIRPIVLYHHERLDGKGYPAALVGEEIPLGARIVCIADVFDALTSDRVYREAYSIEKTFEIMQKDSGKAFDKVLLDRFMEMVHSGKAETVVNAKSSDGEMYRIWARCMEEIHRSEDQPAKPAAPVVAP